MQSSYSRHPALFRGHPITITLSILLIPAFGIGLLLLLIYWLVSINEHIRIEGGKVIYTRGILSKDRTELTTASIRSVMRQGLLQRIMSVGDLLIFTAGDQPEVVIRGIPHPQEAKALLST